MNPFLQHKNVVLLRYTGRLCCSFLLFFFLTLQLAAQKAEKPEELGLLLNVPRVGSTEVAALVQGDTAYLSLTQLFDYLKIRNKVSADLDTISGYFLTPASSFVISQKRNKIFYGERYFTLQPGALYRTETNLYLRADYFGKIFGLDCEFEFRSLSVTLKTKLELPVIREMQMEMMRKNISQLRGERKADTTIGRHLPLFRLGMADWSVAASQYASGMRDLRLNLSVGAVVAGGETSVTLNVSPGKRFDERAQAYRWRYVNNDNGLLRQVSIGKIFPESISTLTSSVKGFQLTNAPTTYRKSFGSYTISNNTEPGWLVELYVNNILINYTKADASGFYSFEVPMVYGNSNVKLRFYGPWGEEQTKEQTVIVPFNFLPQNQVEYTLTGGWVHGNEEGQFGRGSLKYGLGSYMTVGGGVEYFTAVQNRRVMPFANVALRLFSNLILYGEHDYGVRTKGILNYRHRSNLQVDINYTKYDAAQTAVKYLEEKRAVVSMPFRGKGYTAFSRLTLSQTNDPKRQMTAGEFLLSTFFSGISANITTYAILSRRDNPFIRSNLSLTFRLPKQIRLTQQVQYEYIDHNLSILRSEVEKTIFRKGFLNMAFERNMITRTNNFSLGLRFNFLGVQAAVASLFGKNTSSTHQTLRGSLAYDDNIDRFGFSSQTAVGRGGLTIVPFLDANCNGKRDWGEQKVCGLKLRINGGRIAHCNKDTTVQITGLEAYANYLLELDKGSFDNVAWQIKNAVINVVADPNYYKKIEIPVAVIGEAEGKVLLQTKTGTEGLGRIVVRFLKDGKLVAKVMTEQDGYFDYMGLAPGKYTVEVDSDQLSKLNMKGSPSKLDLTIRQTTEGDYVKGLQFVLQKNSEK